MLYSKIKPNTNLIGQNVVYFETIDSTNTVAKQNDYKDGTVIIAESQTAGKGRLGRVWESEYNTGIYMSIVLMPNIPPERIPMLTLVAGISVCNVLTKMCSVDFKIKWPNDIYFNDKKIAGILIKNEIKGMMLGTSIIGIGLNVNQESFDENLPNPISMKMITGENYDLESLLNDICNELRVMSYEQYRNAYNSQLTANIYIKYLYRYKQWSSYEHEGSVKEMMIIGYDQFGRLVLKEKNDREVVCDLKEIVFV